MNDIEKVGTAIAEAPEQHGDVFVLARSQQEMQHAQGELVAWCRRRVATIDADLSAARVNLGIAKASGWRVEGLERLVRRHESMWKFYEKVLHALVDGYTLIPNIELDIIAIRTNARKPKPNEVRNEYGYLPRVDDQEAKRLPEGTGHYVSPSALVRIRTENEKNAKGEPIKPTYAWAAEFQDVDFPFVLAKPAVLSATAQAAALKIFDEIGVSPTGGDPMVVGRMSIGHGATRKTLSFLIAWFIDTKDLP